jgi:hypothetical protein
MTGRDKTLNRWVLTGSGHASAAMSLYEDPCRRPACLAEEHIYMLRRCKEASLLAGTVLPEDYISIM